MALLSEADWLRLLRYLTSSNVQPLEFWLVLIVFWSR
jgi:hypothetical protein